MAPNRTNSPLDGKLKSILEDLQNGLSPEAARARFDAAVGRVTPEEIGAAEQQLIRAGTPASEIQRLCDLHVSVVRSGLEPLRKVTAPEGHPVHTCMAENQVIASLADRLGTLCTRLEDEGDSADAPADHADVLADLQEILEELAGVDNHYLRKEHELFPALERHGITGPPQVMWGVHDDIRRQLKGTRLSLETLRASGANLSIPDGESRTAVLQRTREALARRGSGLARSLTEMVYKEDNILLPMALNALTPDEWAQVRGGEDELGYAYHTPRPTPPTPRADARRSVRSLPIVSPQTNAAVDDTAIRPGPAPSDPADLDLGTGRLSLQQVDMILRHLPVDLSFVDAEGYVRYYSETPERLFPRTPGAIGRHVENCHPPKSLHMVKEILLAFRAGERDVAEFWIELNAKFIHIRYFAVRDETGAYLGCLEVSQDVTGIRALQGVRRLLDWD